MATTFAQTLQDETLRMEVGAPVVSHLAVENIELSTPALSRAVRQSVIERRVAAEAPGGMGGVPPTTAAGAATATARMPGPNRLEMHEVVLPEPAVLCAA